MIFIYREGALANFCKYSYKSKQILYKYVKFNSHCAYKHPNLFQITFRQNTSWEEWWAKRRNL